MNMEYIRHAKRLVKLKVHITLIIVFSLLVSCNNLFVKKDDITNSTANINNLGSSNSTYNVQNINLADGLYGYWLIEKIAFWDNNWALMLSRYTGGRREDSIGKIFEYKKDYCKFGDVFFEDPEYNFEKTSRYNVFDYSNTSGIERFYLENNINIQAKGIRVIIEVNDVMATSIGRYLYLIDEEKMIIDVAGLYMLAIKVDPNKLKQEDIPKPPADPTPTQILGKWKIEDILFTNTDSKDVNKDDYIEKEFEYDKEFCKLDGILYEEPHYSYDVKTRSSMFLKDCYDSIYASNISRYFDLLATYGILNVDTYIVQSIVLNVDEYFQPLGTLIYYIDKSHIFIYGDGACFIATRVQ